jgi:hypothetical protein
MSEATRASYKQAIRQFESDTGFKLAESETSGEALEKSLIQYIGELSDRGTSYGRLNVIGSVVKKYCKLYKIRTVDFDNVYEYMLEHIITVEDRAYTKAEIRELLKGEAERIRIANSDIGLLKMTVSKKS